jgi:hypothetical protein
MAMTAMIFSARLGEGRQANAVEDAARRGVEAGAAG